MGSGRTQCPSHNTTSGLTGAGRRGGLSNNLAPLPAQPHILPAQREVTQTPKDASMAEARGMPSDSGYKPDRNVSLWNDPHLGGEGCQLRGQEWGSLGPALALLLTGWQKSPSASWHWEAKQARQGMPHALSHVPTPKAPLSAQLTHSDWVLPAAQLPEDALPLASAPKASGTGSQASG